MGIPESGQKLPGLFSRRRFQALAAAGVLWVGLGVGAVSGVFAAPASHTFLADLTPVAAPATPGATNPSGQQGHGPGGLGRFGRGPGGPEMRGKAFLAPVATFLGISDSDLQTALTGGQTLSDVAVAHGKSATELRAFLLDRDGARIDTLINTKFSARPANGGFRGGRFGADVAAFLGISETDLHTALKSGQTPAQIAVAHGKTADDLKAYLTNQLKTKLDAAVTDGKLTSQQETDRLSKASSTIDKVINMVLPQRGHRPGATTATPAAAQ